MATISVRFSVQDAEVVRKALADLGVAGEAALRKVDQAQKKPADGVKALSAFVDDLRSKFVGLAVPLGPAGAGLIALGPAGTAAAVGIGAAIAAIQKAIDVADRFADRMENVRNAASALSFTTTQLQALHDVGGRVGLSNDEVTSSLGRLGVAVNEARTGQGKLFEEVRKVDGELARQLLTARDNAAALTIVARAYDQARESGQRLAIARVLGRDPSVGNFLSEIARGGGVNPVTNAFSPNAVPAETIERIHKIRNEIDDIKKQTENIWGQTFSPAVLESQKQSAEFWLSIAKSVKAIGDAQGGGNYPGGRPIGMLGAGRPATGGLRSFLDQQESDARGFGKKGIGSDARFPVVTYADVPLPGSRPAEADAVKVTAEAQLNLFRETMAILGSAITPAEQYRGKLLEIAAAQERGAGSSSVYARSLSAFVLAQNAQTLAIRQRLGIATQEEIVSQRLVELQDLRAKGYIKNAGDMVRAEEIIRREAEQTARQMEIRASRFPDLKQLEIEASDLNRQFDTTATQGVNSLTSELNAFAMGNKKAGDSARDLGLAVVSSINQMIIKMTIAAPIARSLQSLLGAFLPGGAGSALSTPSLAGAEAAFSAKGNVFDAPGIVPFGLGAAFSNRVVSTPTLFQFSKGAGFGLGVMAENEPEAVMPLRRGAGGRLGVAASMPNVALNLAPQFNVRIANNNGSKVGVGQPTGNRSGGLDLEIMVDDIESRIADRNTAGRSTLTKSLEQTHGLKRAF